jgi:hypothetical protein
MRAGLQSWMRSRLYKAPTAEPSRTGPGDDQPRAGKPGWLRRRLGIDEAHQKWEESDERIRDLYD